MNLNDLMLEFLRSEGYRPDVTDFGLAFKVEGLSFLFLKDDNDDQYFRLMMPGIYDINDDNEYEVLKALNETNASMKVVKLYTMGEDDDRDVWVAFEILADSTPELKDFVPRAISLLRAGRRDFYQRIQKD
ncbi:MAG: hypothetical protein II786_03170 [Muribaculaceae bacterium]|nr:hypothetical protein [Muribaculaceae bacterium]MBR3101628.1 hypothetical protein [Muribaculaceae bacterium]